MTRRLRLRALLSAGLLLLAAGGARAGSEAAELLKQKHYIAALESASQALAEDPKDWDAWDAKLLALMRLRRMDEALLAANDALRLAPTRARFWTYRSSIHNVLKQHGPALNDAEMALSFGPKAAEAAEGCLNAAWALDGLGRGPESLQFLRQAVGHDVRHKDLLDRALASPPGWLARYMAGEEAQPETQSGTEGAAKGGLPGHPLSWALIVGGPLLAAAAVLALKRRPVEETPAPARPEAEEAPPVSGSYQVVRQLGIGGMGIVYEALDTGLDRRVAIKKMRDDIRVDPGERERFLKEARMVAALHHPNIVEIYAVVEDEAEVYLVFEYIDGRTLSEILRERKRLPFREVVTLAQGVAAALDYAHSQGIIHRDLKPGNIMVDQSGKVKVMDFGVARQAMESLTRLSITNTVVGTPPYMAAEQDQGVVSKGTDVYALGVCVYEMLSGTLPFSGTGAGMLAAKASKAYVPVSQLVPGLPPGVDVVLDKALEPDPMDRWQSAGDLVSRLQVLS